jgi:hypothetical protein
MRIGQWRVGLPRERRPFALLGLAVLLQVFVIYHPELAYFTAFPLAVPDPFSDVPYLKRGVLPLLFVGGAIAIAIGVWKLSALVERPRAAVAGIYLLGVALHVALIASLADGVFAMQKRAIESGHGEFLIEAVAVADLRATLTEYEPYAQQHTYLGNKGPGVLVLFRGLTEVANAPPMRALLDGVSPSLLTVRWWLGAASLGLTRPQMERLRFLLGLVLVLFPLLTLLPVFLIFWTGRTFVDVRFGLLAASLYPLVPAVALLVAHLDYALFPLLTMGIVAPFVVGVNGGRWLPVALSGAVFALYFTLTLAAASVLVLLASYLGLRLVRRLRSGESFTSVTLDLSRSAGPFALVSAGVLALLCVWLPFDPIERYGYARGMQQEWTTSEYNLYWATANLLGYLLSFGLIQVVLLSVQLGHALRRTLAATADAIDDLAVGWLCLLVALLVFGRHHGETNRLWAFLSPMACLVVGRYVYDRVPPRRWWVPLGLALAGVMLARYRLSYF